jgi:hypothetical protein
VLDGELVKFNIATKDSKHAVLLQQGLEVFFPNSILNEESYKLHMKILREKINEKMHTFRHALWKEAEVNDSLKELGFNEEQRLAMKEIIDVHQMDYKINPVRGYSGLETTIIKLQKYNSWFWFKFMPQSDKELLLKSIRVFYPNFELTEQSYDQWNRNFCNFLVDAIDQYENKTGNTINPRGRF